MISVICSTTDEASVNICKFLPLEGFYRIVKTSDSLNYEGKDGAELNIFVSKHASVKRVKSLTCHTPGNFGKPELGGEKGVLSISNAKVQSYCLRMLKELNDKYSWDFKVAFEVTHHGPSLDSPCLFVEIGSSAEQWNQNRYGSGIADITLDLIRNYKVIMSKKQVVGIGVGGSHYAPSFTSSVLKDESLSIGHICPDYALEHLNKAMLKQMISKTVPEPNIVLINKSVKSDTRKKIIKWCEELSIDWRRLK
jgi:D-aminoacyl-tRNA deacylase